MLEESPDAKFMREYKEISDAMDKKISGADIIRLVLSAGKVSGRTTLQNQVFIAWQEIFYADSMDLGYHADPKGAYSLVIDDIALFLESDGDIEIIKTGRKTTYQITKLGIEKAMSSALKFSVNLTVLLDKKREWDKWDKNGILRYVLERYPKYIADLSSFTPYGSEKCKTI